MVLKSCRVIEAESYDQVIRELSLEPVFEAEIGTSLASFTVTEDTALPVTVVQETLDAAPGTYWYDPVATGNAPRYRIVEISP